MFSGSAYDMNTLGGPIGDYQNPFHDIATATMPKNLKEFFVHAMGIYYRFEIVRLAVDKLAEYAITDLIYKAKGSNSSAVEASYKKLFENVLRIKRLLIRIGKEYYIVGNSFLTFNFGIKRRLLCPKCHQPERGKHKQDIKDDGSKSPIGIDIENFSDIEYKDGKFKGTCPSCKTKNVTFQVEDDCPQEADNIILKTWPIKFLDVIPNRWNDKEVVIWRPPDDMVAAVKKGDIRIVRDLPLDVLESIKKDQDIELDNVFHFKMIGPADEYDELGKGLVLCAYKTIFHTAILQKASEAIAFEHIAPLRVIFPQGIGSLPPQSLLMTQMKTFIEEEFTEWRTDPNHVIISPIPLGQEYLGGQGRAFLPTPEIQAGDEKIFMAFGLPMTILTGNATWASNSISLRIIENHFLTYRDQLQEVIDWIQVKSQNFLNMDPCDCGMKEFKMLDDIQHRSQIIQLAIAGKVPMEDVYEIFDMDYTETVSKLESELIDVARMQAKASNAMMAAQTEQQLEMEADYQARMVEGSIAQSQQMMDNLIAMVNKIMQNYPNMTMEQAVALTQQINQAQQMQQQAAMQQQQADQARTLFLMDRLGKAQWSNVRAQREGATYDLMGGMDAGQATQETGQSLGSIVQKFPLWDPKQQNEYLESVYQKSPAFYEMLIDTLNAQGIPINAPHPMADNKQKG